MKKRLNPLEALLAYGALLIPFVLAYFALAWLAAIAGLVIGIVFAIWFFDYYVLRSPDEPTAK